MRILFITPHTPYPLNSGGNQAFFNMVDRTRARHEVSLLLCVRKHKDRHNIDKLKQIWPDVTFYEYFPFEQSKENTAQAHMSPADRMACRCFDFIRRSMERKIRRRKRRQEAMTDFVRQNTTLHMKNEDMTPDFCRFVSQTARRGFDLIQVEFYEYLSLVYLLPENVMKYFVHHELRYVRNANEMKLFKEITPYDVLTYGQQKDAELKALAHYDRTIVLTETDKELLLSEAPELHICVSPAVTTSTDRQDMPFRPARDLVFVGFGSHFPNADAMMFFCREVLPLLHRKGIMPRLYVVGKWSANIQQLLKEAYPEIVFTGFVENLPAFVNGKISIVPIRIGSGMRMKILDSISMGSPLVTTSKGMEGLPLSDRRDCLIADTAEDFAQAVETLCGNPTLQQELATHAQQKQKELLNLSDLYERRLSLYQPMQS